MSEMVERVARAIEIVTPDGISPVSELMARAAIEAMREPTEIMKAKGYQAPGALFGLNASIWDAAACCWRAMIEEALR